MTSERIKILENIIADLRGSCHSLEEVAEYWKAGDLSIKDLQYIEEEVFQCDECGWWCSTWELHEGRDGLICGDCYEAEEEEDLWPE